MKALFKKMAEWRGSDFHHKAKSWRNSKREQARRFRRNEKQRINDELNYTPDCGGCQYWDGDDGRCRNPASRRFMQETEDGCEMREGENESD